jgi:hypothetical protein
MGVLAIVGNVNFEVLACPCTRLLRSQQKYGRSPTSEFV